MALRYKIDVAGQDLRPRKTLTRPDVIRAPEVKYFNAETNLASLVPTLLLKKMVDVCAAVGAGKSTRLPDALARYKPQAMVFLVVPNPLLAVQLHEYVSENYSTGEGGLRRCLVISANDFLPERGGGPTVVYISASQLVARLLTGKKSCLEGNIVLLDEAHESDAYSYILRHTACQLGASNVIRTSATFSPDKVKMRHTPSQVRTELYPWEDIMEWDVSDPSKPWYYHPKENFLIFTDSLTAAKSLRGKYERMGCRVHILRSDTSPKAFRKAMADSKNDTYLTVLILDYSFRSGFTFNAAAAIDTGLVRYTSGKIGVIETLDRQIYAFEAEQTAGRLGRIAGLDGVYYTPVAEPQKIRTDLEGVELEAVAYLCRLLGFSPLPSVRNAIMTRFDLPEDLNFQTTFNNYAPLTSYIDRESPEAKFTIKEPSRDSESDTEEDRPSISREGKKTSVSESDDVPANKLIRKGKSPERSSTYASSIGSQAETAANSNVAAQGDILQHWRSCLADRTGRPRDPLILHEGDYYYPPNVPLSLVDTTRATFPQGAISVLEYVENRNGNTSIRRALGEDDWQYALAVVTQVYNMTVIEASAMRKALAEVVQSTGFDPSKPSNRTLGTTICEEITAVDRERARLCRCLGALASDPDDLCQFDGLPPVEATRKAIHLERYSKVMTELPRVTAEDYASKLAEKSETLKPLVHAGAKDDDVKTIASESSAAVESIHPTIETRPGTTSSRLYPYNPVQANPMLMYQSPTYGVQTYGVNVVLDNFIGRHNIWPSYQPLVLITQSETTNPIVQGGGVSFPTAIRRGFNPQYGFDDGPLPPGY